MAPLGITEDRYIKAIQTRPVNGGSRRVVHHTLSDDGRRGDDGGGSPDVEDGGSFIVEYASGKAPELYPEDSGVLLKAGHKLSLGTHLHSVGEEVKAEVEIGFKLYPKGQVPKYIRYSTHHGDPRPDADESLDIPAGEVVRTDGYTLHTKPAQAHRLPAAHAHPRQVPVHRADLSVESQQGDEARDDQLRALELQLAPGLQLRGRRGAAGAGGHDRAHHQLARQLGANNRAQP